MGGRCPLGLIMGGGMPLGGAAPGPIMWAGESLIGDTIREPGPWEDLFIWNTRGIISHGQPDRQSWPTSLVLQSTLFQITCFHLSHSSKQMTASHMTVQG